MSCDNCPTTCRVLLDSATKIYYTLIFLNTNRVHLTLDTAITICLLSVSLSPFCLPVSFLFPTLSPSPILLTQGRGPGEQPGAGRLHNFMQHVAMTNIMWRYTLHTVNEIGVIVTVRNKVRGRVMSTVVWRIIRRP